MHIQADIPLAIREANWSHSQDQQQLKFIREQVFLIEQNIAKADKWDGRDNLNTSKHFLAFAAVNIEFTPPPAIACIRVLEENNDSIKRWKIGRVAVLKNYRGNKVAQYFIYCLMKLAKEQGINELILESQCYITGLYEKLGFSTCSEPFMDAGIQHVKMQLKL